MDVNTVFTFDEMSNIWLQPFSVIINCLLPLEYIFGDWIQWQENYSKAKRLDPKSISSPNPNEIESGSRVEGFSSPQMVVTKLQDDPRTVSFDQREYWQPDLDCMAEQSPCQDTIPIFTVEHIPEDPRYTRLRITDEWKAYKPTFKDSTFVNHAYLLPPSVSYLFGTSFGGSMTDEVHGPVRKQTASGFGNLEFDNTGVFKYPQPWPELCMEWLVRVRNGPWPSPEILQDVFESGCHIAPVGRNKRQREPIVPLEYLKNPTKASVLKENQDDSSMDETEWRLSFTVAENKLGASVTPVQRHVQVLLKILKKMYFPDLVSSYHLKNILFWEIEKQEESFWDERNSAKCLLHMLDRLQQCLQDGCLPHYIMPESNLLLDEDPDQLKKEATKVEELRKNILVKSIEMFKRIESLTYHTRVYLQGLDWESLSSKLDDNTISSENVKQMTCGLLEIFVKRCEDAISGTLRTIALPQAEESSNKLLYVAVHAYKSLLGRCLCQLFLLRNLEENNLNESDFLSFIKEKVPSFTSDKEFMDAALVYFKQAKSGGNLSEVVPSLIYTELIREYYKESQEAWMSTHNIASFRSGTFEDIVQNVIKKLRERGVTLANLTLEDVNSEINNELKANCQFNLP